MLKIDRLIDKKYTFDELHEIIKKFKVGQEVTLNDESLLEIKKIAYEMNVLPSGIIRKKDAEVDVFIDLYIGNKFPHRVTILEILSSVGDYVPGARLLIQLPNGMKKEKIKSVLSFY